MNAIATKALVLAEHDNQQLKAVTRALVSAARHLADEVEIVVAGSGCATVAAAAATIAGVGKVWLSEAADAAHQPAERIADLLLSLVKASGAGAVLANASATGKSVLPRVAALLDVAQLSDVLAIESRDTFVRPIYAGNALLKVRSEDAVKVLTVRASSFAEAALSGNAPVATLALPAHSGNSAFVSEQLNVSARPELEAAKIVVSGGRGLGSAENFTLVERLADKLGAAVGASRAAVDAGYVSNALQVGQTGKVVAPALYIAVGISGAIQHLAGMKDSKVIVAINKDPEAAIFQVADYGLVADLFTALPELEAAL
ncbi:MAG: FAD-binding protein [Pseudomonadales bacterium]|jgi:electron transfer flavoprotein alpha subunit|nr:FAD-binding protein [Pseudomonadales bacterium]